jgi:hypothetical protein
MREVFERAADLPLCWDNRAGDHYALKRSFLEVLERDNDLGQRYYLFRGRDGHVDSIMMTYQHPSFDLFMFTPWAMRVPATMVYCPLSISRPGLLMGEETRGEVEETLFGIKGYRVLLNIDDGIFFRNVARNCTCPRVVIDLGWRDFAHYLGSMRSSYRRRCNMALRHMNGLAVEVLEDSRDFDMQLYSFYEQNYNLSRTKIEKLRPAYFQHAPGKILVLRHGMQPLGFIQMIPNGDELVFGFVGYDHPLNHRFDSYMNLLLAMIRYAIENGYRRLDMGQTADDTKLKLGGRYEMLFAHVAHSNPVMNIFVKMSCPFLGYPYIKKPFRVFRESSR